ncbi:RNA pseudouridylate synthase [Plasmodium gonderi]|uniref:RNA pseudouridylate synthase n=1 Tax=Plasmodium gonderi TaxID=77519 RepID=A0A1Y1JQA1_PLAGO|nr:RNA pseudouridylate synthase [Plasmodium gonderi]GAW83655.1 RNA pseudouridylate synthase [Plasmodium gonderi]
MLVGTGIRWRRRQSKSTLASWGKQLNRQICDYLKKEIITHSYDKKEYEQNVHMYDKCKNYVDSKQKIFYDYILEEKPIFLSTTGVKNERGGEKKKNTFKKYDEMEPNEHIHGKEKSEHGKRNLLTNQPLQVKYLCEYKKWTNLINKKPNVVVKGDNHINKSELTADGEGNDIENFMRKNVVEKNSSYSSNNQALIEPGAENKERGSSTSIAAATDSGNTNNYISDELMDIRIDNSKHFYANSGKGDMNKMDEMKEVNRMKLTQYCSYEGLCSSRFAFNNLKKGILKVNDKVVCENVTISPWNDKVEFTKLGKELLKNKNITIILNKPKHYLSILNDDKSNKKLLARNLIRNENKYIEEEHKCMSYFIYKNVNIEKVNNLYVCGRLDANSTGLLIFTQNTLMSYYLLNKHKYEIEKEYIIKTVDPIKEINLKLLRKNLFIDGKLIFKCRIQYLDSFTLTFTIYQGFHKIIRKLCLLSNIKIKSLHRVRIGNVHLNTLPLGKWRFLMPNEFFYP